MPDVKICGIMTPDAMTAALEGGARFVGFLFIPSSRHAVDPEVAAYLSHFVPNDVYKVGLFQDADDAHIFRVLQEVPLDMLQLHGAESPGRVAEIKHLTGLPVIKALSLQSADDFAMIEGYEAIADWLLFDAPKGGSGKTFDWSLLRQYCDKTPLTRPWMLAGGLNEGNVKEALALLDPDAVDVSSGVETDGIKDPVKIRRFIEIAQAV